MQNRSTRNDASKHTDHSHKQHQLEAKAAAAAASTVDNHSKPAHSSCPSQFKFKPATIHSSA
jgi:hypothetical protein